MHKYLYIYIHSILILHECFTALTGLSNDVKKKNDYFHLPRAFNASGPRPRHLANDLGAIALLEAELDSANTGDGRDE